MFGLATKKELEATDRWIDSIRLGILSRCLALEVAVPELRIELRADNERLEQALVAVGDKATANRRRQVDIIAEVEALRAELDANDEDQAEINVDLLRLIELVRQLKEAAKANAVAIDMLLDLQGLKLQARPATEAGWMLVTKEEGE